MWSASDPRRGRARRALLALALALGLLLAGCGGGNGGGSDGGARGSNARGGGAGGSGEGGGEGGRGRQNVVVAWILDLGVEVPQYEDRDAFASLLDQDCASARDGASDGTVLWAAATACLAAETGDDVLWDDAEWAREDLPESTDGCMEEAALELLDRLLAAREENPGAQVTLGQPWDGEAAACPWAWELVPDSGPPGAEVEVYGEHLDLVYRIQISVGPDSPPDVLHLDVEFAVVDSTTLTFTMPRLDSLETQEDTTITLSIFSDSDKGEWGHQQGDFVYQGGLSGDAGETPPEESDGEVEDDGLDGDEPDQGNVAEDG